MYKISSWNISLNILMIFGIKEKSIILTHTVLGIATNITLWLITGFVVLSQNHSCSSENFTLVYIDLSVWLKHES